MNNKPVAWIEPDVIPLTHIIKAVVRREQDEQYSIPLYTHPVKELTDEEIIAVGNAVVNHIDSNEGWIEFARAILRKAQEK
jgi:type IV secretory pathway component VirB8